MKVTKTKQTSESIILKATATSDEVDAALSKASIDFVNQMGLKPEQGKTLAQTAKEKLGVEDIDKVTESRAAEALVPMAISKAGIIPAFLPEVKPETPLQRGKQFVFFLDVMPKPKYELTSYEPVTITVPQFKVDENEVDQEIEKFKAQLVDYVDADPHPVGDGDTCLIAVEAFENGQRMNGLSTEGRPFTVGQGYMPEEFDKNILGMDVGETKSFTFKGPGFDDAGNEFERTVDCTVTVKGMQKRIVPELTDELVHTRLPMFKSVADMRESLSRELASKHDQEIKNYERQLVADELAKRFEGHIDDAIYEAMKKTVVSNMHDQVAAQGMKFEDFVERQGGKQNMDLMVMMQTRQTLIQGYALDAVFRHENLVLTEQDVHDVCREMDPQNPKHVADQFEQNGRLFALNEAAERYKASSWLLERAVIKEAKQSSTKKPAAKKSAAKKTTAKKKTDK